MNSASRTAEVRQTSDWAAIWLCLLAAMALVTHAGKIAGTVPLIQTELSLSFTETGFLVACFSGLAAITGVSFGRYLQRWRLWMLACCGLLLTGSASLLASQTQIFEIFLFLRLLEGAGYMMGVTSLPAIMVAAAAARHQTLTMAIWSCFVPASLSLTLLGTAFGIDFLGWRGIWEATAFLCLATALILFFYFRKSAPPSAISTEQRDAREPVRRIFEKPEIILMGLLFFFYSILFQPSIAYLPSLFLQNGDFGLRAGTVATALCLSVNVLGNLTVVPLLRRGFSVRQLLIFSTSINMICCALIFVTALEAEWRLLAAVGFIGLSGVLPGAIWVRVGEMAANRRQGQLFSSFIFQSAGLGQVFGPILFAWAVDVTGKWEGSIFLLLLAGAASIVVALRIRPDR